MARGGIGFRVRGRFRFFRQRWQRSSTTGRTTRLWCPLAIGLHDQSLMLIQPAQRTDGQMGISISRSDSPPGTGCLRSTRSRPGPDPVAAHAHGHVGEHGRLRFAAAHEHHVVEIVNAARRRPAQPLRQTFQPLDRGDDKQLLLRTVASCSMSSSVTTGETRQRPCHTPSGGCCAVAPRRKILLGQSEK